MGVISFIVLVTFLSMDCVVSTLPSLRALAQQGLSVYQAFHRVAGCPAVAGTLISVSE